MIHGLIPRIVHWVMVHGAAEIRSLVASIILHRPILPHIQVMAGKAHCFVLVQRLWGRSGRMMSRTRRRVVATSVHGIAHSFVHSGRPMGIDRRRGWGEGKVRLKAGGIEDRIIVHVVIIHVERQWWKGIPMHGVDGMSGMVQRVVDQARIAIGVIRYHNTWSSSGLHLRRKLGRSLSTLFKPCQSAFPYHFLACRDVPWSHQCSSS